jgi:hypothetical protein
LVSPTAAGQLHEQLNLNSAGDYHVLKDRKFVIPVRFPQSSSQEIILARVFLSRNEGRSWRLVDSVVPGTKETKVQFVALEDGRYWFALQSFHKDGTRLPRRESELQPDLKVLVDKEGKLANSVKQVSSSKLTYDDLDQEVRALRQTVERLERRIAEIEKHRPGR